MKLKKYFFTITSLLAVFLLFGCATRVLKSNQNLVITDSFTPNYKDAQQTADIECEKYNRIAKMLSGVNVYDRTVTFECVDKDKKSDLTNKDDSKMFSDLKNLKDLLNSKIITQEEFDVQKKKILDRY